MGSWRHLSTASSCWERGSTGDQSAGWDSIGLGRGRVGPRWARPVSGGGAGRAEPAGDSRARARTCGLAKRALTRACGCTRAPRHGECQCARAHAIVRVLVARVLVRQLECVNAGEAESQCEEGGAGRASESEGQRETRSESKSEQGRARGGGGRGRLERRRGGSDTEPRRAAPTQPRAALPPSPSGSACSG